MYVIFITNKNLKTLVTFSKALSVIVGKICEFETQRIRLSYKSTSESNDFCT